MITESGFEIIGGCKVYKYEVACPNYTRAKKAGGFFAAVLCKTYQAQLAYSAAGSASLTLPSVVFPTGHLYIRLVIS